MTRTISVGNQSHLATRSHTRCHMLRLDLLDGTAIGITDHDRALDFDLGDGEIEYSPATGILPSDVTLAVGLDADNYEVTGPIGSTVTLAALLGGRFDRARARLFQVNWASLGSGAIALMAGHVSEVRIEGGRFIFEIRSIVDRLNQTIGGVITPYCPGDHDTCCVQIADETATTVTAAASDREFTVAATLVAADLIWGQVWFTSGALAGSRPVEIFSVTDNTITLFATLADVPGIGDGVMIKEGCDRTRAMCRDRFDNAINFRGCPEVPGSDQALKYAVPGNAGA